MEGIFLLESFIRPYSIEIKKVIYFGQGDTHLFELGPATITEVKGV